jgi:uncharacterized protein YPO0396
MNLCDYCARRDVDCPMPGRAVLLCVEHTPRHIADAKAAQEWHASHSDPDHWAEFCRMIRWKDYFRRQEARARAAAGSGGQAA